MTKRTRYHLGNDTSIFFGRILGSVVVSSLQLYLVYFAWLASPILRLLMCGLRMLTWYLRLRRHLNDLEVLEWAALSQLLFS